MTGAWYDSTLWPEDTGAEEGSTTYDGRPLLSAATRFDIANMGRGHFGDVPARSTLPPPRTRAYRRARWPRPKAKAAVY